MKNDDANLVCQLSCLVNSKTNFIIHLYSRASHKLCAIIITLLIVKQVIECRNSVDAK